MYFAEPIRQILKMELCGFLVALSRFLTTLGGHRSCFGRMDCLFSFDIFELNHDFAHTQPEEVNINIMLAGPEVETEAQAREDWHLVGLVRMLTFGAFGERYEPTREQDGGVISGEEGVCAGDSDFKRD